MKRGRMILLASICAGLTACWPAPEEDRKALVGLWTPDDGSRHTIEFMDNGVFDFTEYLRSATTPTTLMPKTFTKSP